MPLIGAEITELHNLKQSFHRHGATVDDLMSALRSEIHSAYWKGGAADRFRTAWETEYEPALRNLSDALGDAGDEVGRRADALQNAGS
jgi:WXG100 family type VII secretion target